MNKFKQNTTMSAKLFDGTKTAKLVERIAHSAATGSQEAKAIRIGGNEVIHGMEHLINSDVTHFIVLKRRCHIHSVLEDRDQGSVENSTSVRGYIKILARVVLAYMACTTCPACPAGIPAKGSVMIFLCCSSCR